MLHHLVECLQEQNVQGTSSIDEEDGADDRRVPTQFQDEIRVLASIEGHRHLRPLQVLGDGRPYCHDLPGGVLLLPP
jgi:hypothetical protein